MYIFMTPSNIGGQNATWAMTAPVIVVAGLQLGSAFGVCHYQAFGMKKAQYQADLEIETGGAEEKGEA